ncbi:MAG: 30S ribosome-binding factor RbfA [Arcanobacterium sp.]|nr:30S ribosome-binding factor RbfA [Arcanobacterium sp.]
MVNPRIARVADQIQQIVARMIDEKLKDPRLGMVTITDVRVTGDLQQATVFYTVYGSEDELRQSGRALESAKGKIRSQVGQQLGLRLTPTLTFVPDALPETARSIEDALIAAKFHDEQVRKLAAGAQFAGEADPYKKPREIVEDEFESEAESAFQLAEAESDFETDDEGALG